MMRETEVLESATAVGELSPAIVRAITAATSIGPRTFTGTYYHSLCPKSRLVIPAPFRAAVGQRVVLCRAPERMALVLTVGEWEGSRHTSRGAWWNEYWLTGQYEVDLEPTNGRAPITSELREHLGIRRGEDVAICGIGRGILLCGRNHWTTRVERLARRLVDLVGG